MNRTIELTLVALFNVVLVVIDITRHVELWITLLNAATVLGCIITYFILKRFKLRTWQDERRDVLTTLEREIKNAFNEDAMRGMLIIKLLVQSGAHVKNVD